jgi:hypothetical protein
MRRVYRGRAASASCGSSPAGDAAKIPSTAPSAAAAAINGYRVHLRPGERATVLCLACDRTQARIVRRYIAGYFREIPLLAPLVERETDDGLELNNGVEIIVGTNSFRAVRGRTAAIGGGLSTRVRRSPGWREAR